MSVIFSRDRGWAGPSIPSLESTDFSMPKNADMTGSLSYHGMELDTVNPIIDFDEASPIVWKTQLCINDIESNIDERNSNFTETISTLMAKTAIMSDASLFEKDDNLDDNIDDVIFHFGNIDTVVIQVVIPKIIPQSSGWTHTSVMLASLISSATNQLVLQVMFESVGTKSTNIIVLSTVVIVIK